MTQIITQINQVINTNTLVINFEEKKLDKVYNCPHCDAELIINDNDINCGIFRHGVIIQTLQQISSHETEERCKFYSDNNLIYGCGKPFRITNLKIEKCDYI